MPSQNQSSFQPSQNMGFSSKFGLKNDEICDVDNGQMQVLKDDEYLSNFQDDLKLRHREF